MPELTLKDVPESLYARLEQAARRHGWPVDREAVMCLAQFFSTDPARAEATLEAVRRVRDGLSGIHVTDADLERARNEGRP